MNRRSIVASSLAATTALLLALGAYRATAQEKPAPALPIDEAPIAILPPAFSYEAALKRLAAEQQPEASLYLSAMQSLDMARRSGDTDHAEKLLNRIAGEAKVQSVRSAVRRLLVEHYMAKGDFAAARTNLETIVQENLNQF